MKKIMFFQVILVLIIGISISPSFAVDFIEDPKQKYYPSTNFELQITNLTIGNDYSVLLGADQSTVDKQWYNFTATKKSMTFTLIHFHKSSLFDENNILLSRLKIEIYSSDTLQDTTYYRIVDLEDQFNLQGYLNLITASVGIMFIIFLTYIIVKYFLVRNL